MPLIRTAVIGAILASLISCQTPAEPEPYLEYIGNYTVSAYSFYEGGGENFSTAGGYEPIPYWTCAAPYYIPMGTILYIEDFGEVQVQDRGAFPDDWLDLNIGYDPMSAWDMREREVYIVHYPDD